MQYADQGLHSTPQDGTSDESSSEWKTQLEKEQSLKAVVEDSIDEPAGGQLDVRD